MRALPTDPCCKLCASPFGGIGGVLVRPFGYRPSRKNPRLCDVCVEKAPPGIDFGRAFVGNVGAGRRTGRLAGFRSGGGVGTVSAPMQELLT